MSVTIHTTLGDLEFELYCDLIPRTSKNFLALAAADYYNGCIFHRNIAEFIVQSGDPSNTGKGGTSIYNTSTNSLFEDEFHSKLQFTSRGLLAMANRNKPNTNGSQFFITYGPAEQLNQHNTIFGKLINGNSNTVLDQFESVSVDSKYRPIEPITIKSITIHSNPIAEKERLQQQQQLQRK